MSTRFVLATLNRDKARELVALLDLPEIEIVPLADWPGAKSPAEDGATLLDNARIKARAALAHTGLPAIADDTGLEVDALGGAPGVHSARFAGAHATYAKNVDRLLQAMRNVAPERRGACFRTVCVASFPDGREFVAEGALQGSIAAEPRGTNGFGYDPVFIPRGQSCSYAELSTPEKNSLSHRAVAVKSLAEALATL